jgi:hypothetical protein
MRQVLSYGGGTQSVALCLLVVQGRLPRPDCIVMADTAREASSTWEYLTTHVQPLLAGIGMAVEVAPHDLATRDLYDTGGGPLMPLFTATGTLRTHCSNEWKARVVRRHLRGQGITAAVQWLGFSLDERHRVKADEPPWHRRYPLLELRRSGPVTSGTGDRARAITEALMQAVTTVSMSSVIARGVPRHRHTWRRLAWRHLRTLRATFDSAHLERQWYGLPHNHGRGHGKAVQP